ncbi:MAG TPA: hypothetical protein VGU71_22295 [Candidatus Dormibacteraeota bacterium]|nr:hypothetical protein [Candidatus Dormibacteraeota bacterium]
MSRIPLPARECVGIDVESHGRIIGRYDAHNGYVETDNPRHARLLERTFGSKRQIGFSHATSAPSAACSCSCGCQRQIFLAFGPQCFKCRHHQEGDHGHSS